MDVFQLRDRLIGDYTAYVESFVSIADRRILEYVRGCFRDGLLWPDPLVQLNPAFAPGETITELVQRNVLHAECLNVFRKDKGPHDPGTPLKLHKHQTEAIEIARGGHNYVLTTGTGSGKSLAYIVPITDYVLRSGSGKGIRAIVVYPMNALANSQCKELEKFLCMGYPDGHGPVKFARYTGQESDDERLEIIRNPPDILLTNYVMLELIMTRPAERELVKAAKGLRFLVLDELHTYRGRQGADVALLVRRVADRLAGERMQCVGTSATLASGGTFAQQRREVAAVASMIFGAPVQPEHVIGETLQRLTAERHPEEYASALREVISHDPITPPTVYPQLIQDPMASWIESTFGVTHDPEGHLVRSTPRAITGPVGAAQGLSGLTGLPVDRCEQALKAYLLAGYHCQQPDTGFPLFAFRLHQFISRGDTVYASLESETLRHVTTQAQQFVPGNRHRNLFPLVFCRECGQEFYQVARVQDEKTGETLFEARTDEDRPEEGSAFGYLYLSHTDPWPSDPVEQIPRLPDDWFEEYHGSLRAKSHFRRFLPVRYQLSAAGRQAEDGEECWYLPAPFRFCPRCGVAYDGRQKSDFGKLATLTSEGRSTATTILSLSTVRYLRADDTLSARARKLLSFTDNRQDASLQAGHFNDFIETGLLRSAIHRAAASTGSEGMRHEELTRRVFDALKLPLDHYAADPGARFAALENTKRALREVLGYRVYRDLKRGWRVTAPNLEQCGLLGIQYLSLDELCKADEVWQRWRPDPDADWMPCHPALATATPETRMKVARVLLDTMRRELAIKVDYLNPTYQEAIRQLSSQHLVEPWGLDEGDAMRMEHAGIALPRSFHTGDYGGHVYLSPRGGMGNYLGRRPTFPDHPGPISLHEREEILKQLLEVLTVGGLVERVMEPDGREPVPGYQLVAASMLWVAGDGTAPYHDPIRVPRQPQQGGRVNPFFVRFYREAAVGNLGIHAREHTAQVNNDERRKREIEFGEARLPVLFCSPTMELGIDIKELNTVNMRNVPPTPANYAQRSGRAGRSGQPALVFAYCTTGSPHDQYFFRRPERMVCGQVSPPRLDLANEDLVRAHVHAVWLAETGASLGRALTDVLDVANEQDGLPLKPSIHSSIIALPPREQARQRCERILATFRPELEHAGWFTDTWAAEVLATTGQAFDAAGNRWRTLYLSALRQARAQDHIVRDHTRSQAERKQAERLRREAESQLTLLTDVENAGQSDFYSYRYFASEGFLPGYSFPRLPLSAYIPARRQGARDEYLFRPRFLAITEFGPRAIVYHEGSRYVIDRVILPVPDAPEQGELPTGQAKLCSRCGYLHPVNNGQNPDLCDNCGTALDHPLTALFRLQNVSTRRRDRINCDEEERFRLGYELVTGARFANQQGERLAQSARLVKDGTVLAHLTYGDRATIWRINLGWRRRANPDEKGYILDIERGYWAKAPTEEEENNPTGPRTQRVVPYVEDWRNCLLFEPGETLSQETMASLQAALKVAIQTEFQLEDGEIAVEPLPGGKERRLILLYEAAEGGAGVLRRLVDDPQALPRVARRALKICHFDPDTGADRHRAPASREDCEAACYDCLMSYGNQPDHKFLDRKLIRDLLLDYAAAHVDASPTRVSRQEHLEGLRRLAGSSLEIEWLEFIDAQDCRLPSRAQTLIEACGTRPDFVYDSHQAVIYVDGPVHEFPNRQERDSTQTDCLEDAGYTVIRFGHRDNWDEIVAHYPAIFGKV